MPISLDLYHDVLGMMSGILVGFTLGLFGGGGSILAVPLLINIVGVANAHVAIATSAVAVAANAAVSLLLHARHGTVQWKYAGLYCSTGVFFAFLGTLLGKALDGPKLLILFGGLMIVISIAMFRRRGMIDISPAKFSMRNAPKVLSMGAGTGALSGFFGIGGGFLIVPGLIFSTGMPTVNAVATSLVAIIAFGITTAVSYSFSGLVDWQLALIFLTGGALGAVAGCSTVNMLKNYQSLLNLLFAGLVLLVGSGMLFFS